MCGWITGFVFCLLYTLTGRIGVECITRSASAHRGTYLKANISRLARNLGITREFKIVVSNKCRLPFTYRFIFPVLVIPYEAKNWPESKLHTIVIHELAHIRRYDYLVLFLSRFICSVFWFIPVIWIAHAYLQLEQEKICDSVAIQKGERPTVYARFMIDFGRTARSLVLWSGIFIMKRRNKMLDKRVTSILEMKRSLIQESDSRTKLSKLIPNLILVIAVLIIAGSCATFNKTYVSSDYVLKELSGTWVNEEYENTIYHPKVTVNSDGTWHSYKEWDETTMTSHNTGEFVEFNEQWTDSEGNIWYKARFSEKGVITIYYDLSKISNLGEVWETVWSAFEYPNEIDTESPNYRIRYRK
jgi:hypothetical protein